MYKSDRIMFESFSKPSLLMLVSDIDECEAIPGLCEGGSCVNTPGSFRCTCPEGKSRNPINNICEDRSSCSKMNNK